MELLKEKFDDWNLVLKWAEEDENALKMKMEEVLKKEINNPRLKSSSDALDEAETHFHSRKKIDLPTLNLYSTLLRANKYEVLAFLLSSLMGKIQEDFLDVPTHLISSMKGKPCKIRDLEKYEHLSQPKPWHVLSKLPAFLVSDEKNVRLIVRGEIIQSKSIASKFLVSLPTSSSLEQFVWLCDERGKSHLLSTTRQNMDLSGEFDLDVPKGESIGWIDAIQYNDKTFIYWGGTDALRGKETWSYFAGIDPLSETLFYTVNETESLEAYKQTRNPHSFSLHGNLLTLWKQRIDTEKEDLRTWKTISTIINNDNNLVALKEEDIDAVWGISDMFWTMHESNFTLWYGGKKTKSVYIGGEFKLGNNFIVLTSHSRFGLL